MKTSIGTAIDHWAQGRKAHKTCKNCVTSAMCKSGVSWESCNFWDLRKQPQCFGFWLLFMLPVSYSAWEPHLLSSFIFQLMQVPKSSRDFSGSSGWPWCVVQLSALTVGPCLLLVHGFLPLSTSWITFISSRCFLLSQKFPSSSTPLYH